MIPEMARRPLCGWLLTLFSCVPALAAPNVAAQVASAPQAEREVPLSELLAYAEQHAPVVQIAARRRAYAEAARAGAAPLLRYNPNLELGIGPRYGGSSKRDFDFFAALSQPVEIAGQRSSRLHAASRLSSLLDAETAVARWEVRREIALAYRAGSVARERVAIAERGVAFANELAVIARRRLAAGDASAIEVRVAQSDVAQAEQSRLAAREAYRAARIRLAELSGWSIETPPSVVSGLTYPGTVPSLNSLMHAAQTQHPELRARQAAVAEAQARVKVADREAWPTPSVGVQVSREGAIDSAANYILLGTVGVPVPIWQVNRAERARARVDEDVSRAQKSAAARSIRASIARAHNELASAAERVALFTNTVGPQLEDSLTLLRRGFEAGELPLMTVALARERFLAAQRDALMAYDDYYRALAELEFAVGSELPGAVSAMPARGAP